MKYLWLKIWRLTYVFRRNRNYINWTTEADMTLRLGDLIQTNEIVRVTSISDDPHSFTVERVSGQPH